MSVVAKTLRPCPEPKSTISGWTLGWFFHRYRQPRFQLPSSCFDFEITAQKAPESRSDNVRVKKSTVNNKLYLHPQHFFSHLNHAVATTVIRDADKLIVLTAVLHELLNIRELIVSDLQQQDAPRI